MEMFSELILVPFDPVPPQKPPGLKGRNRTQAPRMDLEGPAASLTVDILSFV